MAWFSFPRAGMGIALKINLLLPVTEMLLEMFWNQIPTKTVEK
jgi:hypothetical protein